VCESEKAIPSSIHEHSVDELVHHHTPIRCDAYRSRPIAARGIVNIAEWPRPFHAALG
jgi:hypothetical protein